MIKDNQQEESNTQNVCKDGQLYVTDHLFCCYDTESNCQLPPINARNSNPDNWMRCHETDEMRPMRRVGETAATGRRWKLEKAKARDERKRMADESWRQFQNTTSPFLSSLLLPFLSLLSCFLFSPLSSCLSSFFLPSFLLFFSFCLLLSPPSFLFSCSSELFLLFESCSIFLTVVCSLFLPSFDLFLGPLTSWTDGERWKNCHISGWTVSCFPYFSGTWEERGVRERFCVGEEVFVKGNFSFLSFLPFLTFELPNIREKRFFKKEWSIVSLPLLSGSFPDHLIQWLT